MSAPLSPFPSSLSFSSLFCSISSLVSLHQGRRPAFPLLLDFLLPDQIEGIQRPLAGARDQQQVEQEHAVEARVPTCSSQAARRHLAGDLDPGRRTSPGRGSTMDAALCSSASVDPGLLHAVLLASVRCRIPEPANTPPTPCLPAVSNPATDKASFCVRSVTVV